LHFFTQKQETQQHAHYQLRTKTYYLILKEKILLKIKNPTQKTLSIWNFSIITKMFVVSGSDCRLLKRRQYFLQICFIVNYFRARIAFPVVWLVSTINKSFSHVFECVLYYFYLSFTAYRQACLSDNGQIYFLPIKSRWTATLLLRRSKTISCRSLIVDRPLFRALLIKGNSYTQLCLTLWCGMFIFGKRWCNLWLLSANVDRKMNHTSFGDEWTFVFILLMIQYTVNFE
jgi:hypothetical protein